MTEKTPWFSVETKPVHIGVYECKFYGVWAKYFSYFDGDEWHGGWSKLSNAYHYREFAYGSEVEAWRGLANKP